MAKKGKSGSDSFTESCFYMLVHAEKLQKEHTGKYIALTGSAMIACDPDLTALMETVKNSGYELADVFIRQMAA